MSALLLGCSVARKVHFSHKSSFFGKSSDSQYITLVNKAEKELESFLKGLFRFNDGSENHRTGSALPVISQGSWSCHRAGLLKEPYFYPTCCFGGANMPNTQWLLHVFFFDSKIQGLDSGPLSIDTPLNLASSHAKIALDTPHWKIKAMRPAFHTNLNF